MNTVEFTRWLQGFFDATESLDERQVERIKTELNSVFLHEIDPSYPEDQQEDLNNLHQGKTTQCQTSGCQNTSVAADGYCKKCGLFSTVPDFQNKIPGDTKFRC